MHGKTHATFSSLSHYLHMLRLSKPPVSLHLTWTMQNRCQLCLSPWLSHQTLHSLLSVAMFAASSVALGLTDSDTYSHYRHSPPVQQRPDTPKPIKSSRKPNNRKISFFRTLARFLCLSPPHELQPGAPPSPLSPSPAPLLAQPPAHYISDPAQGRISSFTPSIPRFFTSAVSHHLYFILPNHSLHPAPNSAITSVRNRYFLPSSTLAPTWYCCASNTAARPLFAFTDSLNVSLSSM